MMCSTAAVFHGKKCPVRFHIDVGSFSLVGPLKHQAFTCVSGHACHIDSLRVFYPEMHHELMVLDTCGVLLGPGKTPWNFYTKSIAPQANQAGIAAFASDVTWAPGEYRLCWFGAPHFNASVDGRDFNFDAGSLYLIGPDPLTQSHTCVAGQTCTLTSLSGFAPGETW